MELLSVSYDVLSLEKGTKAEDCKYIFGKCKAKVEFSEFLGEEFERDFAWNVYDGSVIIKPLAEHEPLDYSVLLKIAGELQRQFKKKAPMTNVLYNVGEFVVAINKSPLKGFARGVKAQIVEKSGWDYTCKSGQVCCRFSLDDSTIDRKATEALNK